jgi:hypothetical protein
MAISDVEGAVYDILSDAAGVSALVGTRIYPMFAPQDVALPAIAYQRVSGGREYSHSGDSSLLRPRLQVLCIDDGYAGAKALAAAVTAALSAHSGTHGNVEVQASFLDAEADEYGELNRQWVVRQDWILWVSG